MPLFDFQCPMCEFKMELLVRSADEAVTCPNCSLGNMSRLPAVASFKIKGYRATNGYGLKFVDTYSQSKADGVETGCSFTSNRGFQTERNALSHE